jgi:DNA polymerase-3 subunit epsilon
LSDLTRGSNTAFFAGDEMNKKILPFDTETTGFPNWNIPSDDASQPHIVQLSGVVADAETGQIEEVFDFIIKPDGWEITPEMTEIHGITQAHAEAVGIPEKQALQSFIEIWLRSGADRLAFNRTFDQRIIRIALMRFIPEMLNAWAEKDDFYDSMFLVKKYMKSGRNPKLSEAYQYYFGRPLEGAHNALVDAKACLELFMEVKRRGGVPNTAPVGRSPKKRQAAQKISPADYQVKSEEKTEPAQKDEKAPF